MKKILLLVMTAVFMAACSSDEVVTTTPQAEAPGTEVYAMGKQLSLTSTSIAATPVNYADAYFFIRIDGRIPKSVGSYNMKDYWPSNSNSTSVFANGNKGSVNLDYPYWNLCTTDRYVSKYVYDPTGQSVANVLGSVPTYKSMMSVNYKNTSDIQSIDTTNLKIIWYVAKFTYGRWHVDGVLTFKNVDNVDKIPGMTPEAGLEPSTPEPPITMDGQGNVEVDIHQQQHDTWQTIKTSVHVRDLVDKVTVEIPIGREDMAETDDFDIRTYDLVLGAKVYINGHEYTLDSESPVKITIEHQMDKAVFTIACTDAKYLAALRKEYGDGVTVEIFSYPKNLTKEEVWAKLKQAKVTTTPATYEHLHFTGATSAFFSE